VRGKRGKGRGKILRKVKMQGKVEYQEGGGRGKGRAQYRERDGKR
jgi:hypothetical protein